MKKYLISLLLIASLCAALLLPVSASQEGYVFDLCGVFDEVESLNAEADTICQITGIAPYFIITDDQGGLEGEEYIEQFAQQHGFDSDAIVILDGESACYVTAFGTANDYVSEDELIAMRDAYADSETYSGGVRDYFNLMFTTLEMRLSDDAPAATEAQGDMAAADTEAEAEAVMAISADADAAQAVAYSTRLIDRAGLLNAQEGAEIAALLDQVSEKHGVDVVIVTESTLGGKDMVAYADDFYDDNGYAEDGILLLYCPNESVRYISTCGKAIDWFDGDNFSTLTEAIKPCFESFSYAEAFTTYAETCDEIIEDETAFPWLIVVIAVLLGVVLSALIPMNVLKGELKSVRAKAAATDYVRSGSMNLTQDKDIFLYHTVTRTEKPKNNSGNTHTSSSGTSHGGGSF